jgi:hypothetical protein
MPSLREYAARRAVKAAGGMTKDMRALEQKGMIESTGRELLDKGIVKLGSSLEGIAEAAGKAKEKAGQAIGAAIDKSDEVVGKAKDFLSKSDFLKGADEKLKNEAFERLQDSFGFSTKSAANRIRSDLIAPNDGNPMLANEINKLAKLADQFDETGAKSLKEGLSIKSSQRRLTNFDSDTVPQGFKQDVYKIIKEELEASVGQASKLDEIMKNMTPDEFADSVLFGQMRKAKALDDLASGPAADFANANKQYAIMANTEDMAQRRFGAAQSNRENSLTDTIAEGFGLMHGGIGGAAALGAANKAVRRWGSSTAAVGANELAKTMEAMPDAVKSAASMARNAIAKEGNAAKASINAIRDGMRPSPVSAAQFADNSKDESGANKIKTIIQTNPQALGKYGPVLRSAMERGGNSYAVTHFLMQQRDPEYRQLIKTIDESH